MDIEGVDGGESTRIERTAAQVATGPTRIDALSPMTSHANGGDFVDAVLGALLGAQVTWLATRDVDALRRELVLLLAQLV